MFRLATCIANQSQVGQHNGDNFPGKSSGRPELADGTHASLYASRTLQQVMKSEIWVRVRKCLLPCFGNRCVIGTNAEKGDLVFAPLLGRDLLPFRASCCSSGDEGRRVAVPWGQIPPLRALVPVLPAAPPFAYLGPRRPRLPWRHLSGCHCLALCPENRPSSLAAVKLSATAT